MSGFITLLSIATSRTIFSRFPFFYPSHLLPRDGYYSYILTVSMLLLGSHLSREMCTLYANLCIISVFHTAQYCVKNEWIFNMVRRKSRIPFRLHLTFHRPFTRYALFTFEHCNMFCSFDIFLNNVFTETFIINDIK